MVTLMLSNFGIIGMEADMAGLYINWLDVLQIVMALALVLLNGFFVAAEFALVKVRPTRIAQLVKEGDPRAKKTQDALLDINVYLSVCQLGITLSSLGLGWLGEPAIADLLTPLLFSWGINSSAMVHTISFVTAFVLITFVHVVIGEQAPKTIAIQKAENIALKLAAPMKFFYLLFYPGVMVLNGASSWLIRSIGLQTVTDEEQTHSEDELRMLITASFKGGHIDKREQELLQNVFRFEQKVARDVMIPRTETVFLYLDDSMEENIAVARGAGHTRFPVCRETPDNIVGLIHIKDLFFLDSLDENSMDKIMRDIIFIPEGMPLERVLHQFQKSRQHMAIVVDEYGGCAGVITMENLLEELVGDIQDEFDQEETQMVKYQGGTTLLSGRMLLKDAYQHFGLPVDDDEEDYDTLGGYVFGKLGKPPQKGDSIALGNFCLEVMRVKGMRIDQLKLTALPDVTKVE